MGHFALARLHLTIMAGSILILLVGLAVYAGYGLWGLAYLLGMTALCYGAGRLIPRHRWVMWVGTAVCALSLLAFKSLPLLRADFAAPLGASYYTMQVIAYLADVYRGKYPPEKRFLRCALFVTYLPHVFLGPIEPFQAMSDALDRRHICWDGVSSGAARALWGAFKKLIIAARAGMIVSALAEDPARYGGAYALIAMLLYSVQLYADFSGGIDIALGVSRMLGVRLSENFNAPFLSQSVREFWRRWHITLGAWLREYIYIPLGGSRKGKLRKALNCIVTFLVSGLWHGLHYLLWGLLNGLLVACGDRLKTRFKTLNRVLTFLVISLLWSFFVWPDTGTALSMLGSLFTTFNYGEAFAAVGAMLTAPDWIVLLVGVLLLGVYDVRRTAGDGLFARCGSAARTALICALALAVLVFGMYGIGFNASAFIYSRF